MQSEPGGISLRTTGKSVHRAISSGVAALGVSANPRINVVIISDVNYYYEF
jgi:hypothetical protein